MIDLTAFIAVARTDTDSLRFAASLGMRDFEDALQVAAARACDADVIATRNVRDFRRSPISAVSPEKLLRRP